MDLLWMVRTKLAVNLRDLKAMMVTGFADGHLHMWLCGKVLPILMVAAVCGCGFVLCDLVMMVPPLLGNWCAWNEWRMA